ncbi:hypothetical protein EYF80_038531 [Liparis tanakae]|uniref:Uncharacterized protein n=1 Tax=Liparis tanakae TaxID=230148 RepID=A0A4Z2GDC9_9TELE|nr:hypothetical protein EYF80_038531 [Liparis tanakae]
MDSPRKERCSVALPASRVPLSAPGIVSVGECVYNSLGPRAILFSAVETNQSVVSIDLHPAAADTPNPTAENTGVKANTSRGETGGTGGTEGETSAL